MQILPCFFNKTGYTLIRFIWFPSKFCRISIGYWIEKRKVSRKEISFLLFLRLTKINCSIGAERFHFWVKLIGLTVITMLFQPTLTASLRTWLATMATFQHAASTIQVQCIVGASTSCRSHSPQIYLT